LGPDDVAASQRRLRIHLQLRRTGRKRFLITII
jgi:hypothetical protein